MRERSGSICAEIYLQFATLRINFKQMKKIIICTKLLIVQLMLLVSCTDVVDVEVPNGGDRLVIEASIEWEKGTTGQTQSIFLSTSATYFEQNKNTPVIGATVIVTKDNDGSQFLFEDQNDGVYITNDFVPELGQSYSLEIKYNGNTYEASEVLKGVEAIEEIEQIIDSGLEEDEIGLNVYFNDPGGIANFYLGEFTSPNDPLVVLEVENDDFTDGNQNMLNYDAESLMPGDTVKIELQGISESYFNYMELLIDQAGGDFSPFPTTPVQLKGNCININNNTEEVLGFFRLSEVVKEEYVLK